MARIKDAVAGPPLARREGVAHPDHVVVLANWSANVAPKAEIGGHWLNAALPELRRSVVDQLGEGCLVRHEHLIV